MEDFEAFVGHYEITARMKNIKLLLFLLLSGLSFWHLFQIVKWLAVRMNNAAILLLVILTGLAMLVFAVTLYVLPKIWSKLNHVKYGRFIKIAAILVVCIYFLSFVFGSNSSLVVEPITFLINESPFILGHISETDTLNLISNIKIKDNWISKLGLGKKYKLLYLPSNEVPCDEVGFAIYLENSLVFINFIDVCNTPCPHMLCYKIAVIWLGFKWKIFYYRVSGVA